MTERDIESVWLEVQRRAAAAWVRHDFPAALDEVDKFLQKPLPGELRGYALAFRASIRESAGHSQGALDDYRAAYSLASKPSYRRYTVEICLGNISEKSGRPDEAVNWYRAAIETSLEAEGVASGTALSRYLRIRDEHTLSKEERDLCNEAVRRSWNLLEMQGDLDLGSLSEVAERLVRAQGEARG